MFPSRPEMGDGRAAAVMNGLYTQYLRADRSMRATVAVIALPRPAARVELKRSAQIRPPEKP